MKNNLYLRRQVLLQEHQRNFAAFKGSLRERIRALPEGQFEVITLMCLQPDHEFIFTEWLKDRDLLAVAVGKKAKERLSYLCGSHRRTLTQMLVNGGDITLLEVLLILEKNHES